MSVPSLHRVSWTHLSVLGIALFCLCTHATAQTDRKVQEIVIHSGWGGLGPRQEPTVTIRGIANGFEIDGKPVKAAQVQALVSAVQAAQISKPGPANMGITMSWLQSQLPSVKDRVFGKTSAATSQTLPDPRSGLGSLCCVRASC